MTDERTEAYNAHGTKPHPLSTRVSLWPAEKAPTDVRTMCDRLWPERDSRVHWWFGCCSVAENPTGFPLFVRTFSQAKVGRYWWALAFEKSTHLEVRDVRDDLLAATVDYLGPMAPPELRTMPESEEEVPQAA